MECFTEIDFDLRWRIQNVTCMLCESHQKHGSSLLVFLRPGNGSFDRIEGRLGTLTVLHEGGDVSTRLNLAEVLHVSADDRTRLILDGLHPPPGEVDRGDDELLLLLGVEVLVGHVTVAITAEEHHVSTVDIELEIARAEHHTIADWPGRVRNDLHCVHTVIRLHLRDRLNRVISTGSVSVPIFEEWLEVIGDDALNHFLLTEAHHYVGLLVPSLAHLNIAIFFLNLQLMLIHSLKSFHKARLASGTDLLASLLLGVGFYHLLLL